MIEVKGVVLLAVLASVITAVPLNLESDVSQKLSSQKFLQELEKIKVELAAEKLNEISFRLPNNTEPISYDIRLRTDIHNAVFGFQGEVRINIRALQATTSITLHSFEQNVTRISLYNPNGSVIEDNLFFTFDEEVSFFIVHVNGGLGAGQEVILLVEFTGVLSNDLFGFFRTSYRNSDTDQEIWLATTQFQPIQARNAFPCYDEIRYRTPIDLQIRHHRSYNAISNMPVAALLDDDSEYVTTVFERTLPIPTFVLAFTVSDFDFVQNTDPDLELRVYGRPAAIASGQADDGLRLGEIMLRTMEDIFDIEYTLPKSDQIAIPSFASDGALNWGLITHREDVILQFSNDSVAQNFREIRTAHEYSHIFFGNLVAPTSWAYLWLNEGMATLYENILNDIVFNEKNQWESFLIRYYDVAITVDVLGGAPPLNQYVETPQEIRGKFDFVTYSKGAIILRMFYEVLLAETFTKGIRHFILDRQFENAEPADLYNGLQRSYLEDIPWGDLDLAAVMGPWFDLPGYPVVTVSLNNQGITLRQEGFRTLHNESFPIPINFATESHPDFDYTSALYWMTTPELYINRENSIIPWVETDWIILNVRDTAYYITNYDDDLWEKIITALNDDHEAIHFLNRGTLFADFHRFLQEDFDIRATFIVRITESLPLEFHPHVFNRASLALDIIEVRLRTSELHSQYRNFMQDIMSQIYGERSFDRMPTDIINEWSCWSGVQECLDDALDVLIEVLEDGATDYEFDFQCNGLRAANESIWMSFYYRTLESSDDRSTALRDLLCTEDLDIISFYLNQVFNTTNGLSTSEREVILTAAAVQHELTSYMLIEVIEEYFEELTLITRVSNLLLELASVTNSYLQAERVSAISVNILKQSLDHLTERFVHASDGGQVMSLVFYLPEDDDLNQEHLVQLMQPNLNFIYRNLDELYQWFERRNLIKK